MFEPNPSIDASMDARAQKLQMMTKMVGINIRLNQVIIDIVSRQICEPDQAFDRVIAVTGMYVVYSRTLFGVAIIAKEKPHKRQKLYKRDFQIDIAELHNEFVGGDKDVSTEDEQKPDGAEELSEIERLRLAISLVNQRVDLVVNHLEENDELMNELAELNNMMRNR